MNGVHALWDIYILKIKLTLKFLIITNTFHKIFLTLHPDTIYQIILMKSFGIKIIQSLDPLMLKYLYIYLAIFLKIIKIILYKFFV